MKDKTAAAHAFHKAFKLNIQNKPTVNISQDRKQLRFELMKEENEEYLEAAKNNDLVEVADALGDMLYILCGTIIEHGMQDKIEENNKFRNFLNSYVQSIQTKNEFISPYVL